MFCSTAQNSSVVYSASKNSLLPLRTRTKKDYAFMVKVVKCEYAQLPLGAIYLYEHLVDCDYADPITKLCKGYVFHKIERISQDCRIGKSSVYRYLSQLRKAALIKTKRRGQVTYIYLLDLPEGKLSTYDNEPKFSKTQNQYNRNLLTNRRIIANVGNVDLLFSAREYRCYERLVAWGYHPTQAIRDISNPEYGVEEIERQLDNLHWHLQAGLPIKTSCAQWLNYNIRNKYRPTVYQETAAPATPQKRPRYIELVDEVTQTIQLVEIAEAQEGENTGAPATEVQERAGQAAPPSSLGEETQITDALQGVSREQKREYWRLNPPIVPPLKPFNGAEDFIPIQQSAIPRTTTPPPAPLRLAPAQLDHPSTALLKQINICFWNGGQVDRSGRGRGSGVCVKSEMKRRKIEIIREIVKRKLKFLSKKFIDLEIINVVDSDLVVSKSKLVIKSKIDVLNLDIYTIRKVFYGSRILEDSAMDETPIRRLNTGESSTPEGMLKHPPARRERSDKGIPRLGERDIASLKWIGEMYAIRLDQLQVLLSRLSGENGQASAVGKEATRKVIERWRKLKYAKYRKVFGNEEGWIWLTPAGLRAMGFKESELLYRNWEIRPAKLPHYLAVNRVRLALEARGDGLLWVSERTIKSHKVKHAKGHDVDGEVQRGEKLFAVEVELTSKKLDDVRDIIRQLLENKRYTATWYFVTPQTRKLIERALQDIEEQDRKRIIVLDLESA